MVFQDPATSLNPRMLVKNIIAEAITAVERISNRDLVNRVLELLNLVGLTKDHLLRYPHEFSGGQCQRIGIARSLVLNPRLVICDEPVSALDVSIQAQIINLLQDLQSKLGLALIFIAHDLSLVKHISDRIMVMYMGSSMELSERDALYRRPLHPYTRGLMKSIPRIDESGSTRRLAEIPGLVPNLYNLPQGCSFFDRCPVGRKKCRTVNSQLFAVDAGHSVRCWLARDG